MELMTWSDGKLEERLDRIDERFEGVNRRITKTAEATDHRLNEVERRITETAAGTNRRLKESAEGTDRRLTEAAKETDRRFTWVEEEVRGLKQAMQTLHGDINRATIALWVGSAGVAAAILVKG